MDPELEYFNTIYNSIIYFLAQYVNGLDEYECSKDDGGVFKDIDIKLSYCGKDIDCVFYMRFDTNHKYWNILVELTMSEKISRYEEKFIEDAHIKRHIETLERLIDNYFTDLYSAEE